MHDLQAFRLAHLRVRSALALVNLELKERRLARTDARGASLRSSPPAKSRATNLRPQSSIENIRWNLGTLRNQLAWCRLDLLRKALHPSDHYQYQPRVPKGNPDGGQWTVDGEIQSTGDPPQPDSIRLAQVGSNITDAYGQPYYQPGGHHEVVKAVYKKWKLRPETLAVFEKATTGSVPKIFLRTSPDGVPQGHFWNGPNGAHAMYNQAVEELADQFLERNNLKNKTENMTPDHARALLKEVRESKDPRIRNYNDTLRLIRRLFPLRTGRGIE